MGQKVSHGWQLSHIWYSHLKKQAFLHHGAKKESEAKEFQTFPRAYYITEETRFKSSIPDAQKPYTPYTH